MLALLRGCVESRQQSNDRRPHGVYGSDDCIRLDYTVMKMASTYPFSVPVWVLVKAHRVEFGKPYGHCVFVRVQRHKEQRPLSYHIIFFLCKNQHLCLSGIEFFLSLSKEKKLWKLLSTRGYVMANQCTEQELYRTSKN
jgi:hypothetical protein